MACQFNPGALSTPTIITGVPLLAIAVGKDILMEIVKRLKAMIAKIIRSMDFINTSKIEKPVGIIGRHQVQDMNLGSIPTG
jgi:hypothetical protein